jgi:hypothetical protein
LHDFAKGGAWPLLVGEVICLLNCVNERDLCQLLDGRSVVGVWPVSGATRLLVGLVPNYALRR